MLSPARDRRRTQAAAHGIVPGPRTTSQFCGTEVGSYQGRKVRTFTLGEWIVLRSIGPITGCARLLSMNI
jgi:hypothetical protein